MSSLYGFFNRDGAPVAPELLRMMQQQFSTLAVERSEIWTGGSVGMGCLLTFNTPEARGEQLPRVDATSGLVISAAARLDNRDELCDLLRVEARQRLTIPDSELILQAFQRWGDDCVTRLYGDWSFAIWNPTEQRLFLARDHHGVTALYYYASRDFFAFASDQKALLALDRVKVTLDELYLAQVLVSWPAHHGERTIYTSMRRLPPAHTVTVTPDRLDVRRYWYLEHVPELHLSSREAYIEGFRALFDEAVRARMRSAKPVGVTLSGGLDSGSVSVTAADILRERGERLAAFTSVPLSGTEIYLGEQRFGDEWPLAQATARCAGNIDLYPVDGHTRDPLQAIHRALAIHSEPIHAAANAYWMQELFMLAHQNGLGAVLTGQMGNAGISWTGEVRSLPLAERVRRLGRKRFVKELLKHAIPPPWLANRNFRLQPHDWYRGSAIHPAFVKRLDLLRRMYDDDRYPMFSPAQSPRHSRFRVLQPGRSFVGALHAQNGAASGIEIRDPTSDVRVLEFAVGVPDHFYFDPKTGQDRWLIREAMAGRLPDGVRLNARRGSQAADIIPRLRAIASAVDTDLDQLASGRAAEYLDVPYMREVWQMIQTRDTPETFRQTVTILTRGIMAGLFVNQFGGRPGR